MRKTPAETEKEDIREIHTPLSVDVLGEIDWNEREFQMYISDE